MKWVKASERLPEKIEDVTKNSYSVKCYNRKDAIYWCDNNWQWIGTSYKLSERDFNTLEWLDEQPSSDKLYTEQDFRMKHAELEDKYEGRIETLEQEIERLKGIISMMETNNFMNH